MHRQTEARRVLRGRRQGHDAKEAALPPALRDRRAPGEHGHEFRGDRFTSSPPGHMVPQLIRESARREAAVVPDYHGIPEAHIGSAHGEKGTGEKRLLSRHEPEWTVRQKRK